MQLHDILSARYIEPAPSTAMQLLIDATIADGDRDEFTFIYRPSDNEGLSPEVNAWFFAHPDFEVEPFVETVQMLEEAVAAKLAELDDYRWQREVGGADFGGVTIRTDWNSQAKVTAAYTMAKLDPAYVIPTWEVVPGVFMALDNATIVAMGEAVRDHVQSTFDRKAALHGVIAGLDTAEAVQAFDIAAEW